MADDLAARLLAGDRRALARLITLVENQSPQGRDALRLVYAHTGRAHTVGITGGAGAGKSTLTNALAKEYRRRGKTVGIVAVDPSSPFTRGAILGDRIRMQELTGDPGIFMRSMATRGSLGGLSETAADAVAVLDAFGKDVVLLETVGAGQDEVAVANAAQTTVLVLTPGTGDDVQTMKAGIMEIADLLVVNKADLPNTDALIAALKAHLSMSDHGDWLTPILRVVANRETGIGELVDALESHREHLRASGKLASEQEERARQQIVTAMQGEVLRRMLGAGDGALERLVAEVAERRLDPHTAAERLLNALLCP
ncbi:MAG: methylmalonyl Co-A mutase-associated GTPase MeaB [Dehalococcoidia bacterium]